MPPSPRHTSRQPEPLATRTPITRRRTGCFTCRRRRKKCDETKPECIGCRRSGYICEGYPISTHYQQNRWPITSRPAETSTQEPQYVETLSQDGTSYRPPDDLGWAHDGFILDALDCFFPDNSSTPADQGVTGVLEGRENSGLFLPTTDTESSTVQQPASLSVSTPQRRHIPSQQQSISRQDVPRGLPFLIKGIESHNEQRFFCHFTNVTSRVLTLSMEQNNPLLTIILPRSLEDPMIQRALLCLGASHLVNQLHPFGSDRPFLLAEKTRLLKEAEQQQQVRISSLRVLDRGSSKKLTEHEAVLTSALLLCLYEIAEGKGDKSWKDRLDTAREIIQDALEEQSNAGPDDFEDEYSDGAMTWNANCLEELNLDHFLLEFFVYHDILAGVTESSSARSPALSVSSPGTLTSSASRQSLLSKLKNANTPMHMIGVNDGLFDLISRIAALSSRSMSESVLSATVICEAIGIWQDLDSWEQPITNAALSPHYQHAYAAYKCSLFVWLFSIIYPDNMTDDKVSMTVRQGIDSLALIQTSGVMAFLLFPVFILGVSSIREEDRSDIEKQFDQLEKFSGLGNVRVSRGIVRKAWETYDSGKGRSWDWMTMMEREGLSVPVT